MDADRERILADGWERLAPEILRAKRLNDEFLSAVAKVERIRREVEQQTGVSLIAPPPLHDPALDAEFRALMESGFFPDGVSE